MLWQLNRWKLHWILINCPCYHLYYYVHFLFNLLFWNLSLIILTVAWGWAFKACAGLSGWLSAIFTWNVIIWICNIQFYIIKMWHCLNYHVHGFVVACFKAPQNTTLHKKNCRAHQKPNCPVWYKTNQAHKYCVINLNNCGCQGKFQLSFRVYAV